jgi:hypothetical protein
MKRKKLTVFLVLLALAFICLFSATLFAGEHPWDADKGGGSGGSNGIPGGGTISPGDTTHAVTAAANANRYVTPPLDIRSLIVFKVSYYTAKFFESRTTSLKSTKTSNRAAETAR